MIMKAGQTCRKKGRKEMKKETFIQNLRHIRLLARDLYITLLRDVSERYDEADCVLDDIDDNVNQLIDDIDDLFDRLEVEEV